MRGGNRARQRRAKAVFEEAIQQRQATALRLQGLSIREIAKQMGLPSARVGRLLKKLEAKQEARADRNLTKWRAETLAKLDVLEQTCWEQWRLSCEAADQPPEPPPEGAPRPVGRPPGRGQGEWLDRIASILDRRAKLLGMDKTPPSITVNTVTVIGGFDESLALGLRQPGDAPPPFILDVQAVPAELDPAPPVDPPPPAGEGAVDG